MPAGLRGENTRLLLNLLSRHWTFPRPVHHIRVRREKKELFFGFIILVFGHR